MDNISVISFLFKPQNSSRLSFLFYLFLSIVSLLVLCVKIYLILKNYTYIFPGNDPAFMMENIQVMISSKSFYVETLSRSFIPYFSTALKLITNISTVHVLLLPTIISLLLGFFLSFVLAREIFGDVAIALLATSIYAVVISAYSINSVVFYGLIFIPILLLAVIKYLKNKAHLLLVGLLLFAGLNSYSQLFFLHLGLLSLFFLGLFLIAGRRRASKMFKKSANFFMLVIGAILLNYVLINNLVPEHYQGFDRIFWFLAGLRKTNIIVLPYLYSIYYVFLGACLILFLLKFIQPYIQFAPAYFVNHHRSLFKRWHFFAERHLYSVHCLYIVLTLFVFSLLFIDLLRIPLSIEFIKDPNFIKYNSVSLLLFKSWFSSEVWQNSVFLIKLLFLMALFGLLYVLSRNKWKVPQYLSLLILFITLQLIENIAALFISGARNIGGVRGLYSLFIPIIILFSYAVYKIFALFSTPLRKMLFVTIIFVLSFSTISLTYYYTHYVFSNDHQFMNAIQWFEKNNVSRSYVYIEPYYPHKASVALRRLRFEPYLMFENETDLYQLFGKYYIYSFFTSTVPYIINDLMNYKQMYYTNMYLFAGLLDRYNIRYLIFDTDNYIRLEYYLDPFIKIVFQNEALIIAEYRYIH